MANQQRPTPATARPIPDRARGRRNADLAAVEALAESGVGPFHDAVTGLANPRLLRERISDALAVSATTPVTVAFVNLDRFNRVNESAGHAGGDHILRQVAARLTEVAGPTGTAARLGGDEFAVMITDVRVNRTAGPIGPDATAGDLGETVLARMRQPFDLQGTAIVVTASVGTARIPDEAGDADGVLYAAGAAMRRAKQRGGDAHHAFAPGMVARGPARLLLEAELRTAISSEQLRVHYQPQVALDSGAVVGVEALVRWDHPERGLLLPGSFIPMAEESGLVVALDQWVLDTACRQLAQWIDAGADAPRMAVNLSARSLQDPRVAAVVAGILERYQLPAAALELEVTETLAVRRPDDLLTVLMELRALGVSLAVDDFGSGYTVLAWLERWPLDRLKIDAQFVATITEASPRAPIVAALIALSHELGFRVVAEGVETPTQLATLRDLGCDEGQGFLLGRPQAGRPQPGHIAAFVRQVQ